MSTAQKKPDSQYPLNLLGLLLPKQALQPTAAQEHYWHAFSQQTDVIADNLVLAFRQHGVEGRQQFNQALEQGLQSISNPLPEIKAFFEAMEHTPYWVDFSQIELAQHAMSRIPHTVLMPIFVAFGLPVSYIISKVNQTLIRSGNLEQMAASRLVETVAWLVHCATPGGLQRGAQGFKSTAQVRLVHAYMRAGLNHLKDWDYAAWDRPINQTQQALTMTPFLAGTLLSIPFGHLMSLREIRAIFHFYRYLSHLLGIHPGMQIGNRQDMAKMVYLTFKLEVQTDELSPRLGKAMANAIPDIYGLPKQGKLAKPLQAVFRSYHSNFGRLILGKDISNDLAISPFSPMLLGVVSISLYHFAKDLPLRLIPPLYKRVTAKRLDSSLNFLDTAAKRLKADLQFNREHAKVNSSLAQKAVV